MNSKNEISKKDLCLAYSQGNYTAYPADIEAAAHVSETNQASSHQSRTVDEILGAHFVNGDFLDNTNPTDVSIDTVNSEEQMAGSHTTKFNTHEDKQPVLADLLSQEDQDFHN